MGAREPDGSSPAIHFLPSTISIQLFHRTFLSAKTVVKRRLHGVTVLRPGRACAKGGARIVCGLFGKLQGVHPSGKDVKDQECG